MAPTNPNQPKSLPPLKAIRPGEKPAPAPPPTPAPTDSVRPTRPIRPRSPLAPASPAAEKSSEAPSSISGSSLVRKWADASIVRATPAAPEVEPAAGPEVASPSFRPGELGQIGQYQLMAVIGEGGMGVVYRAEDLYLRRPVALKVMKPDPQHDSVTWQLFLREARATAALKNPRIATIYQVGEEGDTFYLAMELLKGESLESRMDRGPVSLRSALWLVREAALGLAVAHHAGFVHRDIKPANLWLETESGKVEPVDLLNQYRSSDDLPGGYQPPCERLKLLDFGLVRYERGDDGAVRRGVIVGTPGYMAPEQARGDLGDARADIYSLGVVLFRLVTGRLPFDGETALEILTAVASETAPLASKFNPKLPPALVTLIQRMLCRDPMGRPGSAADVAQELEFLENELFTAPPPKPASSRRTLMMVAGIAALVLAAGASFWAFKYLGKPRAEPDLNPAPPAIASNEAVLAPNDVLDRVGEKVCVDFTVRSALRGANGATYLTAEQTDGNKFRLVISRDVTATLRNRGYTRPDLFVGAKVRARGLLVREDQTTVLQIGDLDQFDQLKPKLKVAPGTADSKSKTAVQP